jgi:DNA excision repair protein ERCC-4
MKTPDAPVYAPFRVIVDTREQAPYRFTEIPLDSSGGDGNIVVPLITDQGLKSGDYSIAGYEIDRVAVERKSMSDLFGSVGGGRDRFEREIERLNEFDYAAVVVEAEISEIVSSPPPNSKLAPKTVLRTAQSWSMRYPMVHWFFLPGRRAAELWTFRLLDMYWRHQDGN